jgi:hypothetical protein
MAWQRLISRYSQANWALKDRRLRQCRVEMGCLFPLKRKEYEDKGGHDDASTLWSASILFHYSHVIDPILSCDHGIYNNVIIVGAARTTYELGEGKCQVSLVSTICSVESREVQGLAF